MNHATSGATLDRGLSGVNAKRRGKRDWSGGFVGLGGFGGLGFVGLGYRFGRIVGLVHRAFEIANRLAQRPADVAEFAGAEDHQNDQQNDQQVSWREQVHLFLRAAASASTIKVYILDYRIATPIPAPSGRAGRRLLMHRRAIVQMIALDLAIQRREVNSQHL